MEWAVRNSRPALGSPTTGPDGACGRQRQRAATRVRRELPAAHRPRRVLRLTWSLFAYFYVNLCTTYDWISHRVRVANCPLLSTVNCSELFSPNAVNTAVTVPSSPTFELYAVTISDVVGVAFFLELYSFTSVGTWAELSRWWLTRMLTSDIHTKVG